jgi:hypothetical protein
MGCRPSVTSVQFGQQTWNPFDLLARDRKQDFKELADEAFTELLLTPVSPVWGRGLPGHRAAPDYSGPMRRAHRVFGGMLQLQWSSQVSTKSGTSCLLQINLFLASEGVRCSIQELGKWPRLDEHMIGAVAWMPHERIRDR